MKLVLRDIRKELDLMYSASREVRAHVWSQTELDMTTSIRRVFEDPLMVQITGHVWQVPYAPS
ncbi:MAG: hypothetical protein ACXADB_07890 [Candidatus Hermodarchaeia archaeon]|jgi:hypothetical protein